MVGTSGGFPWASVFVYFTGRCLLGLPAGVYAGRVGSTMRLAVFFALLGGYTTFSTFTAETVVLARAGSAVAAFGNVTVSMIAGLVAAFAGILIGESLGSRDGVAATGRSGEYPDGCPECCHAQHSSVEHSEQPWSTGGVNDGSGT